ncbi:MAG: hypothetical protein QXS63_05745 [Zestosphaera sp.]
MISNITLLLQHLDQGFVRAAMSFSEAIFFTALRKRLCDLVIALGYLTSSGTEESVYTDCP